MQTQNIGHTNVEVEFVEIVQTLKTGHKTRGRSESLINLDYLHLKGSVHDIK